MNCGINQGNLTIDYRLRLFTVAITGSHCSEERILYSCLSLMRFFSYNTVSSEDTASVNDDDVGHLPVVSLQIRDRTQENAFDEDDFFPLSSSKYRYCKWHELDDVDVKGNMLRSPRIRRAPKGYKLETLRKIELEEGMGDSDEEEDRRMLHVPLRKNRPKRTNNYRNKMENWENVESVNLSYQDLGHPFQKKEFLRVLRRLIRCEQIQLIEDSLTDLSSVTLPRCKKLFLQRNFISDLKKLPKYPMLEHLSLQQNSIDSLSGLELLALKTQIKSLTLKGNPVELIPNYRQQVFRILPNLKLLDGTPKLESDEDNSLTEMVTKTCIVS
ncbi:hypothetical protein QZH41_019349 [Actinostola sp. cb2023]|nr:hypothetical protein QZH41_019349 [Actinostola sp. cb2023]